MKALSKPGEDNLMIMQVQEHQVNDQIETKSEETALNSIVTGQPIRLNQTRLSDGDGGLDFSVMQKKVSLEWDREPNLKNVANKS